MTNVSDFSAQLNLYHWFSNGNKKGQLRNDSNWVDGDSFSVYFPQDVVARSFANYLLVGLQKKYIYKSRFAMHECYTKHGKKVESCLPYANINNVVEIGSAVGGTYFSS
ncbi:uncharacterized protein LOC103492324 isoform X2 [Cucumis melo]|nr:uncharacterized protein LOC103492324 isoform X2 [Cucumis melo]